MSTDSQTYQWQSEPPRRAPLSLGARVTLALAFVLFVTGGILFGYIFYSALSERMTQPLNPVQAAVPVLPSNKSSTPASSPEPNTTAAPSGTLSKERVNILLLGIDQRDSEAGQPTRTDTMILLTIDPVGKTMGMLSIPRDLWVPIPGLDKALEERINAAHFFGDLYKYPGGGTVLAKKTVQYNLGVPVHYYVRVDFKAFEKIVDALGGVTINVETAIRDTEYPDGNYGIISIYIPAGVQHMDGETALRFVRTRHADSDFGRTRRQLQFLMAMRDQALKLNILPKAPSLISQFRDSIKTDMSANEILSMARLASQIESDKIISRSIDETMITPWVTPQGGEVLIPKRDEIKKVVAEVFGTTTAAPTTQPQPAAPTPVPTATTSSQLRAVLAQENARIEVLNGTNTKGLAGRTQVYLNNLGYNVVTIGDAGRYDYSETVILYYAQRPNSLANLVKTFSVRPDNIRAAPSARLDADIRVILGANARIP